MDGRLYEVFGFNITVIRYIKAPSKSVIRVWSSKFIRIRISNKIRLNPILERPAQQLMKKYYRFKKKMLHAKRLEGRFREIFSNICQYI
jgi:hypothetical protein